MMYQIRTEDLKRIIFEDSDLENTKKHCLKGCVIVDTKQKKFGIDLRISWMKWHKPIQFTMTRNYHSFNILWLHVSWDFLIGEVMNKIIWKPKE